MPYPGIELFREYGPDTANRGSATETAGEFGETDIKTGGWLGALGGAAFLGAKLAPRVAKPILTFGAAFIHKVMGKVGYVRTAPVWVPALVATVKRSGGALLKSTGVPAAVQTAGKHGVTSPRMLPPLAQMGTQAAGYSVIGGVIGGTIEVIKGIFGSDESARAEAQPEIAYTAAEAKENLYKNLLPEPAQWFTLVRDLFITYYFGRKAFMTLPAKSAVNIKFDVDFGKKLRIQTSKGRVRSTGPLQ
jgi:hypothetical protein